MSGPTGMKVTVAGAGALGSVLALFLADAGAEVTLVDPGGRPNASAVAAGMVAPVFEALLDGDTGVDFAVLSEAAALWGPLSARIGVQPDRAGALAVATAETLEAWEAAAQRLGATVARRSAGEAEALVSGLKAADGALFTTGDFRIDPAAVLAAVARAGSVRRVLGRIAGYSAGVVRLEAGETWAADRLVVATGAAVGLAEAVPELKALRPIKGHILRLAGGPSAGPMVRLARGYLCPSPGGAIVGASMQPGRCDTEIEPEVVARLLDQARAAFPALDGAGLVAAAGVRAETPDHLPLAGRSTTPDMWIAGGARRNGWLLAPLIARALTDALLSDGEPQLPAGFDPRRFG
ncbi:NAD(P)/FAD-dependent oxidoreductase [Caulobacter sp. KR2-114]|uniref:NAD(P)/FAD-dependent oxidoreductase n=1 Tax=Caulobacter sp. KR2-114 TaxID=3400912 RepID=UPI003C0846C0